MRTGRVTRGRARPLEWEAAVAGALVGAWRCRLELALLAVPAGVQRLLAGPLGELGAAGVVAALAAVVLAVAPARRLLWRGLRPAWLWAGVGARGDRRGPV